MRNNKFPVAVIFCAIALVASSLYYFQHHENSESKAELSSTAIMPLAGSAGFNYRGPLDDCVQNGALYSRTGNLGADCTLNYVHFYPNNINLKKAESAKGTLKIGSFNLFHLGDSQSSMKNFSF